MPYYMYVALQEDDKIAVLTIDPETGTLTPQGEVAVPGGPFTLAISPDRKYLYAGCRTTPQIASFAITPATGGLTQHGAVSLDAWPVYVATDRTGKFGPRSRRRPLSVTQHDPTTSLVGISWHCHEP